MGCNYTGFAIIGVEVAPDKLKETKTVRSCSCPVAFDENDPPKFCSKCGKPWHKRGSYAIDGYDEGSMTFKGLKIAYTTDNHGMVIGESMTKSEDYGDDLEMGFVELSTSLDKMKKKLKDTLGPYLWDETRFGLYSLLHCSY